MSLLTALPGLLAILEIYFAAVGGQLGLNGGVGLLLAAPFVGAWAQHDLVHAAVRSPEQRLKGQRELVFGYECLILGSANVLAGPHVLPAVAGAGAAVLACAQSLVLALVFRNPGVLQPIERSSTPKSLSVRFTLLAFLYLALTILACAIFIPRSAQAMVRAVPIDFQWPGIVLLYAAFGCLALGLASEHSWGRAPLYLAVVAVVLLSTWMEVASRHSWYFLVLTLIAFLALVPGWPGVAERGRADPPLARAAEPDR
jgi:hypothetical protein